MFGCRVCSKTYQRLCTLRRHASGKHPLDVESIIEPHINKKFKCSECGKRFNNKESFSRHKRFIHNLKEIKKNQLLYHCALCDFTHNEKTTILSHISADHELDVDSEAKEFQCEEDFLEWKLNQELIGNCKFIATGGKHKDLKVRRQTFVCNRTQYYISKVSLKRALTLKEGTRPRNCRSRSQLNAFCPAEIKYSEVDGIYKVQFLKTHTHRLDFEHIRLSSLERSDITKKISTGISFNSILDHVRHARYQGKEIKRKYLVNKKYLLNMEESFSLYEEHQQNNDKELNFGAWIKEEAESNYSSPCILFHKPQGEMIPDFPSLTNEEFVLILMNESQSALLKTFGTDTICVDGTYELSQLDLHLTVLSVIDDSGQGFPCVFLISNRCDSIISRVLFLKLKETVGEMYAENFMSGMDDVFFNGYKSIMPQPKNRLFCSWRVDQAWRENLSTIESIERQVEVYKILRTMLEEPDEDSFYALFAEAKEFLLNNRDTQQFGNYFVANFEHNITSWAFCFRSPHSGVNTNVHLERMYRTIKHLYCSKKKVKRLDDTLHLLQKFVRDYLFNQLILRHDEIVTSTTNNLRIKHKESLQMDPALVVEYENRWICSSSHNSSIIYCIQRDSNFEQCECQMKCPACNVCVHNFTCTCIDNVIQWNMCKHIHLLCRNRLETDDGDNDESTLDGFDDISFTDVNEEGQVVECTEMQTSENVLNANEEQAVLEQEKLEVLSVFENLIEDANKEQLDYIRSQVTTMQTTLDNFKNSENVHRIIVIRQE